MKLETDKIYLRPFEADYAPAFYAWYYSGKYEEYYRRCPQAFIFRDFQKYVDDPSIKIFCIFEKETNLLVGTCGVYEIRQKDRSCKMMILVDEAFQGKGYMIDSLKILAGVMINTHGFHKIGFDVLETNERLKKILENFGFKKEAVFVDSCFFEGKYFDEIGYYILEDRLKVILMEVDYGWSSGTG